MANPVISNNDNSQLEVLGGKYQQDIVDFGTAETRLVGEILARKLIATAVVETDGATNTGDGTCTLQALAAGGPAKVGDYTVECVEAITNGGRFSLTDPDSIELDTQIIILAGAGGVVEYIGHGLTFLLTDGATDFIVGDLFTLTVAADGALDSYDPAGLDGTADPVALMTRSRTEATAGDYPEGVLIEGEVRESLVDTATTPTITDSLRDLLLSKGIILRPATQMLSLDNQ